MDKKWWIALRNNKALKLFKKYIHQIINELYEKQIKQHMFRKDIKIDEILIEESSKEIDNYLKIKTNKTKRRTNSKEPLKEGKRNINLLYMCLLKFNGLLKYMYFQGLNQQDIQKMAHFIRHTFRKKGSYVFRQFDKSNALYGVIKGKAVIRLVETNDYTKKFLMEASNGDFNCNPPERINIQYFMSDCEEESEEDEEEESDSEYSNNKLNMNIKDNSLDDDNKKRINNSNESNEKVDLNNSKDNKEKKNLKNDNKEVKNNKFKEEKEKLLKKNKKLTVRTSNIFIHRLHKGNNKTIKSESNKLKLNSFKENNKTKLSPNKNSQKLKLIKSPNNSKKNIKEIKNEKENKNNKEEKEEKRKKKEKEEKEKEKKIKIIKAIQKYQTPVEPLKGIILENFIKEFEKENFSLTNGMCFGEWGLLYSIPRTTSIYASEDTHLFYLEKEYFNKTLLTKILKNDSQKIKFLLHKFPIFKKNFKIRHIFTKIVPLFVNKDNIIYTPFDKAENIYLIYQGEGILVNLPSVKEKEEYILKKTNWQIISRLQEGGIAGIESCLGKNNKYENAFIITREYTTILKLNIQFFSELYKDFSKSLIPLYKSQQIIYHQLKKSNEKAKKIRNLKRKFSLSKYVKGILDEEKKRTFSNDFQINKLKLNLNKSDFNNNKIIQQQNNQKVNHQNKKNQFRLKLNTIEKKNINTLFTNKFILDNLSTRRKSNVSPLSSERKNNEILSHSSSRNTHHTNCYLIDKNSFFFKTHTKDSSISISNFRCQSAFSNKKNQRSLSFLNVEKVCLDLKKKLLSYNHIDTGMYNLPLVCKKSNSNTIAISYKSS